MLAFQLVAKNIHRIRVQGSSQAAFCRELRLDDGDGFAMLSAQRDIGNISRKKFFVTR